MLAFPRRCQFIIACALVAIGSLAAPACITVEPRPAERVPLAASNAPASPGIRAAASEVGVYEERDPGRYGRVVALSDVHGEFDNLIRLLQAANLVGGDRRWAAGRTLLIVTGDSIDKGPQSLEVLEFWMDLGAEATPVGGRVVVLLGNHEAEYLSDPENAKAARVHAELDIRHLPHDALAKPGLMIDKYPLGDFLRSLPVAARVGNFLFCHAGWPEDPAKLKPPSVDPTRPEANWTAFVSEARATLAAGDYGGKFLTGKNSILEKKGDGGAKWWDEPDAVKNLEHRMDAYGLYGIVLGHQPGAFGRTGDAGTRPGDDRLIKIDSGMAPKDGEDEGDAAAGPGQPFPGHLLVFTDPRDLTRTPADRAVGHVIPADHERVMGFDSDPNGPVTYRGFRWRFMDRPASHPLSATP